MPLFKKRITEEDAATEFVHSLIERIKDTWPLLYNQFYDLYKGDFIISNHSTAVLDLTFAIVAQEFQVLRNLFDNEQSNRLIQRVMFNLLSYMDTAEQVKYAKNSVELYDKLFQEAMTNIMQGLPLVELPGDNPLYAISSRLIRRWVGGNIRRIQVKIGTQDTGSISPTLIMLVTGILVSFTGFWSETQKSYKLTRALDSSSYIDYSWLQRKLTTQEVEGQYMVHGERPVNEGLRLGFPSEEWKALTAKMIEGDELWVFSSPKNTWRRHYGRGGITLVRDGVVTDVIVTVMN